MDKICILIPCYNEENVIGKTIKAFQSNLPNASIIVCDNNSTDNTLREALNNGARVIVEKKQGKGFAMKALFDYVKKFNYNVIIMVDGDNTYSADNVKELVQCIKDGNDMVIGLRSDYFKENKKIINRFGNRVVLFITKTFLSKSILDPLSGYRVFSKRFIDNYPCDIQGFEIEMDMNIWAKKNKMKIKSIPINYKERGNDSYSKINWKDGVRIIWRLLRG